MKKKYNKGVSLIESMVVIVIFSLIGVLSTRSLFLTLRGTSKSQSLIKVRENVNYSLSIIQRLLRNAQGIVECPNINTSQIEYLDSEGNLASFVCNIVGTSGYIASSSARLTSNEINITACSFVCLEGVSGNPPSVSVSISAEDSLTTSLEKGKITSQSKIFLRTY